MAWIRVVGEDEADEELNAVLRDVVGGRGKLSNILAVHSLLPATMKAHMDLYTSVMFGASGLSRAEREMIAVVVSATNECSYCVRHHGAALEHYWKDEERVSRFAEDHRSAEVSKRMRAVLDYAEKLTASPASVRETDIEHLREHGLSDADILSVNLIASYFDFVNRIALGLGVAFSEEEVSGYNC